MVPIERRNEDTAPASVRKKRGLSVRSCLEKIDRKKKRQSNPADENALEEARQALEDIRLQRMLQTCSYDVMDPAVLEGDIRLPESVLEKIEREDFSDDDLRDVLTDIGRDNIAQLVALLKNKDPQVQIEAWQLLMKITCGEKKQTKVTGSGQGGGIIFQLVAPTGETKSIGEDD